MIAVNFDTALSPGALIFNKKCYEDVPNYSREVYGHNMKTECIVHEDMLPINKGDNPLSRCGQCLELVGPTLKTITCVVTQTFRSNGTITENELNNQIRSVGVSAEILTLLTTDEYGTDGKYNQVTVREADCRFHLTPKLFVVDTNETTATLQVVNSNKVIEKITTGDGEYYITPDAHFYVSTNSDLNKIIIHTLDGNSTSFFNVNLTTTSSYTSDVLMPIDTYDYCLFITKTVAYSTTKPMEDLAAFGFKYFTYNADLYVTEITIQNNQLLFTADDTGEIRMSFVGKNILLTNRHFNWYYLTIKSDTNFELAKSVVGLNPQDAVQLNMANARVIDMNYEVYSYEEDGYIIKEYKFFIPQGFIQFSNAMSFRFSSEANRAVEVLDAYYHERFTNPNENCDYNSTSCYGRECTYEGDEETDLPWIKGCEPECGRCRTGYQCSKEGKCIIQTNYNMRSYSNHVIILLITFISFLIL